MTNNSITEEFPRIIKDYWVTSFTGQKLDQDFGSSYYDPLSELSLMETLEAIGTLTQTYFEERESMIEDYETQIEELKLQVGINAKLESVEVIPSMIIPPQTAPIVVVPEPPIVEKKKRGRKPKDKPEGKVCVACEGSGNNSKGEVCPICKPVILVSFEKSEVTSPVQTVTTPSANVGIQPSSIPPWLAPKVEPAAPAFFAPPPPPPFYNPNA